MDRCKEPAVGILLRDKADNLFLGECLKFCEKYMHRYFFLLRFFFFSFELLIQRFVRHVTFARNLLENFLERDLEGIYIQSIIYLSL